MEEVECAAHLQHNYQRADEKCVDNETIAILMAINSLSGTQLERKQLAYGKELGNVES